MPRQTEINYYQLIQRLLTVLSADPILIQGPDVQIVQHIVKTANSLICVDTTAYQLLHKLLEDFQREQGEYFNIQALASDNEATFSEYIQQFKLLAKIIQKHITYQGQTDTYKILTVDAHEINRQLSQKAHEIASEPTQTLYASEVNLGVLEKALTGQLPQNHWLTEVDLHRFLKAKDINDVHITRLNKDDIGTILHYERDEREKAGDSAPYFVSFIINASAHEKSQGSHWTYLRISINPREKTITSDYIDSLPISLGNKKQIEKVLREALKYDVVDVQAGFSKPYQAFPNYQTPELSIESTGIQKNHYMCGDYALQQAVKANTVEDEYAVIADDKPRD